MELQENIDVFDQLDAQLVSIAQIERDPAQLSRINEFVHNTFPILADPDQITRADFEIFSVYLIDKEGTLRTHIPGVKEARARLDVVLEELAKIEGVDPPEFETLRDLVVVRSPADEAPAAAPVPDNPADLLEVQWMWSHNSIRPEDAFKLAFVVNVAPGYHVYGANETKMHPFRLELDLPKGISLAEPIKYPKAETKTDPILKVPLDAYETVIPMPVVYLKAAKKLKIRDLTVTARIHFQACNDSVCLQPTTKEIQMTLPVVAPGARRGTVAGSGLW